MIVKDAADTIQRALQSARPLITAWVIVDTGSTDTTSDIIKTCLLGIPGRLYHKPWVNFAYNRNEALKLADNLRDYILLLDADDELTYAPNFVLPKLKADCYNWNIQYGGIRYHRRQLIKAEKPWYWVGPVHEYITCDTIVQEEFLSDITLVCRYDSKRARDGAITYRRDALLLEKALIEEPNNARYRFYLAQSYRDCGELELALYHYQLRARMTNGWNDEAWYSLYQIAAIRSRLGESEAKISRAYLTAFEYDPSRAESLYHLAMYYPADSPLRKLYLDCVSRIPLPSSTRLFVEPQIYS